MPSYNRLQLTSYVAQNCHWKVIQIIASQIFFYFYYSMVILALNGLPLNVDAIPNELSTNALSLSQ